MELADCRDGAGPEEFVLAGKDIQNKGGQSIGSASTEDHAFHEFFGTTIVVVLNLWRLLAEHDMIPDGLSIKHLLWVLDFL